jgi:hypothetical protein
MTAKILEDRSGKYYWLSVLSSNIDLAAIIHSLMPDLLGNRVLVTSFDSGPFIPNANELSQGWAPSEAGAFSPLFDDKLTIPTAGYDEWLLTGSTNWPCVPEVFVNWGGFSVAPNELDLTGGYTARFWAQLPLLPTFAYLASGDRFNLVSDREALYDRVAAYVRDIGAF